MAIEPRFLCPPIKGAAPVLSERLDVVKGYAVLPGDARQLVGPARAAQSVLEIVKIGLRDTRAKGFEFFGEHRLALNVSGAGNRSGRAWVRRPLGRRSIATSAPR